MESSEQVKNEFPPRLHNEVYPFIYPKKFKGSLQDKVAIITGSAGTLGQALAKCFAVAGAKLWLVYNRTAPPPTLKEECFNLGARSVTSVQCNVADFEGCKALIQQVLDTEGNVDILVNNAGANSLGPVHEQDPQQFIREFEVNFNGPYYLMRLLLPSFRERGNGCILNIASRAGTVDIPYSASYCSSKAALINLTGCTQKELDVEGFKDVHLYALHPGGVLSEMTRKKYSEESVSTLPGDARSKFKGWLDMYTDSPYLNGMVCVALATGIAKDVLRGKYFDVGHDLEDVVTQGDSIKRNPEMYALHTTFLGGLSNLNPVNQGKDEPFTFPGEL